MYLKDKEHRVIVRVNDKQFKFLKETSKTLDVSPSEFMRMVVNSAMVSTKMLLNKANRPNEKLKYANL